MMPRPELNKIHRMPERKLSGKYALHLKQTQKEANQEKHNIINWKLKKRIQSVENISECLAFFALDTVYSYYSLRALWVKISHITYPPVSQPKLFIYCPPTHYFWQTVQEPKSAKRNRRKVFLSSFYGLEETPTLLAKLNLLYLPSCFFCKKHSKSCL